MAGLSGLRTDICPYASNIPWWWRMWEAVTRPPKRSSRPTFSRFGKYPVDMVENGICEKHLWTRFQVGMLLFPAVGVR